MYLKFNTEFDLGTKNTCHSDYLEVIERDDDGTERVVRRFCGGVSYLV